MKKIMTIALVAFTMTAIIPAAQAAPMSSSGVKKAYVKVPTDSRGMTIEQKNVGKRILTDNKPGTIKHLYVISAFTGDILIYSTVKGKVTSSGKRLSPITVQSSPDTQYNNRDDRGIPVNIGGEKHRTTEVLQDDGTYGSSVPYVYWFDTKNNYHQHYITGGQIFHVTNAPLATKKAIINMEILAE